MAFNALSGIILANNDNLPILIESAMKNETNEFIVLTSKCLGTHIYSH